MGTPGIKQVKNTYSSVEDYISTFEPLLFEEVKAQIVRRNDDDQEDSVIEWKHGAVAKCPESDGFHLPEVTYGSPLKDTSIAQNDLLLLTKEKFQDGKKLSTTFAFALLEHRKICDVGVISLNIVEGC